VISDEVIGIVPVDLSSLLYVDSKKEVSGYFHIFRREDLESVKDAETNTLSFSVAKSKSLGEVKICISSDIEIKRVASLTQRDTVDRLSPLRNSLKQSQENPFSSTRQVVYEQSFGKQEETQNKLSAYMSQIEHPHESSSNLKQKLQANLSVLDQLTEQMKRTLGQNDSSPLQQVDREGEFEREQTNVFNAQFSMTQGVKADLRTQLQPLTQELQEQTPSQKLASRFTDPNSVVMEE